MDEKGLMNIFAANLRLIGRLLELQSVREDGEGNGRRVRLVDWIVHVTRDLSTRASYCGLVRTARR